MSPSGIVVYGPPDAPFTLKVTLGLAFKGVRGALVVAPSGPEDFRRWSPETGLLPVIDFAGTRVADSSRILDFLDERLPEPPLLARDPVAARQQRRLEAWIGETFYFYWMRFLRSRLSALGEPTESSPEAEPGVGELARLGIAGRLDELLARSDTGLDDLGPEFARRLGDLAGLLGDRPFFYAERPSRADLTAVAFFESLENGSVPGGPALLATQPRLVALAKRFREALGG